MLYRNRQTHHDSDLGNNKHRLKKFFHLVSEFQLLSNYLKYKYYNKCKLHLF